MRVHDPRTLLLTALLLDWLGQLLIFAVIALSHGLEVSPSGLTPQLEGQWPWLIFCLLLYPLLGWLFGSYTVLRWRRLSFSVLLQRLLITASATLIVVAIARWLVNPSEQVWLVYRRAALARARGLALLLASDCVMACSARCPPSFAALNW